MKEKIIKIFLILIISFIVIASAEEFGYNNQELPQLEYQPSNVNNNTLNVNNSQFLGGYDSSHFVPYLGAANDVDLGGYRLDAAEVASLGLRGQSGLRNTFAIYDVATDTWIIYGGITNDEMSTGVWTNSILPLTDSTYLIGNESLYYSKIYGDSIYAANVYSDYSWLRNMASGYLIGLVPSGILTTARNLYINVNDKSSTLNIAGNTSLNQDVNTSSSPTFNNLSVVGNISARAGKFVYIDQLENTTPINTPPTNTLRLFVENTHGFSVFKYLDDTGMKREIVRDNMIVVKNVRGSSIPAYRFVYATGSQDNVPTIDLARADSMTTMPAIGVTIEAIADSAFGRVMQVGIVENINSNSFNEGDILYVSDISAGLAKSTSPLTPNLTQEMGVVLVKDTIYGAAQIIARGLTGNEFGTINNFTIIGNLTAPQLFLSHNNSAINFASGEYIKGNQDNIQFFGNNGSAGINNLVCNLSLNSAYYADFGCWNQSYSARSIRFLSSVLTSDDIYQIFGTSSTSYLGWNTAGNDHLKLSVAHGSATAGGFIEILDNLNIGNDYSFPIQYHPTLSVRSNRSSTLSNKDSLNFQHNGSDAVIWTQNGSIYLYPSITNISSKAQVIINQTLALGANVSAIFCRSQMEGSIYYDGGTKKHYGCDGTTWNALY